MEKLLAIITGGSIGCLSRYYISNWVLQWMGPTFPFGTLTVNLLGCFIIGLIAGLPEGSNSLSPTIRLFAMTGLLGGLTTFSTYEYESFLLAREGLLWETFINIGGSVILGFIAVWVGYMAARFTISTVKGI